MDEIYKYAIPKSAEFIYPFADLFSAAPYSFADIEYAA
jgi:hypothetical protein